ncbi:glycosyltransferase family 4 protein [Gracilibacillus suaedae]|uniref:glycosyltransferase family 4 protein n=1 Tax=Gracilibacillus suaedae TaxID=2820273 RepID=UPI001ABE2323|nr:glycosyltransferase family 4 protein [Gracilibacillus suaedae]
MKKVLFISDPLDLGLSIEHQLYLIHRHLEPDSEPYVKLLENDSLFLQHLNKQITVMVPISHVLSSARKDFHDQRNWCFTLQPQSIPLHIRKAYYNFPSLVRLYWNSICEGIAESHTHFDEAVSLSSGIPSLYLRDKIQADKKIYYFPIRQFKKSLAPVMGRLRQQDLIYTASQSMYCELAINNDQIKYYADPYYKESLCRVLKLDEAIRCHSQYLSILSANNLQHRRHIEGFIQMVKYLVKQCIAFKWYFYGDHHNETLIRNELKTHQLEDHVVFVGDIANVFRYLEQADVYVEWEPQSALNFEAETMEKPIIYMKYEPTYHFQQILKLMKKYK